VEGVEEGQCKDSCATFTQRVSQHVLCDSDQTLCRDCRHTQQKALEGPSAGTPVKGRASSPDAETDFKSGLSDPGTKTSITVTGRSPSKLSRAPANGPSTSNGSTRAVSNGPLPRHSLNGLASAVEADEEIQNIRAMIRRLPFKHKSQVEYYALPPGVKVTLQKQKCTTFSLSVSTLSDM